MVIRHSKSLPTATREFSPLGESDKKELTVRGWQRAGALAGRFAPARGALQSLEFVLPKFLFTSNNSSKRPRETITPLANRLGLNRSQFREGAGERFGIGGKGGGWSGAHCVAARRHSGDRQRNRGRHQHGSAEIARGTASISSGSSISTGAGKIPIYSNSTESARWRQNVSNRERKEDLALQNYSVLKGDP